MSTSLVACSFCKHSKIKGDKVVCSAFPNGIPKKFLNINTTELKECANGVKFERD